MKVKGELIIDLLKSYETTVWASQVHIDRTARINPEAGCQILEKSLLCCVPAQRVTGGLLLDVNLGEGGLRLQR